MTKPMLIEALKPGMRAKLLCGIVHHDESGFIKWEQTGDYCNHAALTSTDFEIVEEKPKPWEPKGQDYGWGIDCSLDVFRMESTISQKSLKTKQAAIQKSEIDSVVTALLNMPEAFEGTDLNPFSINVHQEYCCVTLSVRIPFSGEDANKSSYHAVEYACCLLKKMEAAPCK